MNDGASDSLGSCPALETLRDVVAGKLAQTDERVVISHLDRCAACRARLEALHAVPAVMAELRQSHASISSAELERVRDRCISALPSWQSHESHVELVAGLRLAAPRGKEFVAQLGAFDVVGILGHGGMGFVLEAYDPRLRRTVALKLMRPELAGDRTALERFVREARAAAGLEHPNVVTIHDICLDSRPPFLVMECVRGRSLSSLIGCESPLRPVRAARITLEILAALACAHGEGIIHRDVKPSNVLLDARTETVKLADFGLARAIHDARRCTVEGSVVGTPWYMAPEQAAGKSRLDGRCDVFSTGVVLFEMLTAALPFPGIDPREVMRHILKRKAPDPRELNARVPPELAGIVSTAMRKNRRNRYPTAVAFAEALQAFLAKAQTAADEPTASWIPPTVVGEKREVLDALLKVTQARPAFRGRVWIRRFGRCHARDILTVTRDNRDCCRIGEPFTLQAHADVDCYLTLLDCGTSGAVTVLLLNHRLRGGDVAMLSGPDERREWVVGEPPGIERIKAYFTRQQLVIDGVQPFSPLAVTGCSRDIVTRINDVAVRLEQMPGDSWTDATCQFVVEPPADVGGAPP